MRLEKAIIINTRLAKELDIPQRAEERKAVKLGIEALKAWREAQLNQRWPSTMRLPGETED